MQLTYRWDARSAVAILKITVLINRKAKGIEGAQSGHIVLCLAGMFPLALCRLFDSSCHFGLVLAALFGGVLGGGGGGGGGGFLGSPL